MNPNNELSAISSDIQAAIEAGKQLAAQQVHTVNGMPLIIAAPGMEVHELPHLRERPARVKQAVSVGTAAAFIEYFNEFATDHSVIFCDIDAGSFRGVLDYHADRDTPAWGDHTVTHVCQTTKEWDAWLKANGQKMDQIAFAFFIEQNLEEILTPPGAQMLEIATTLKASTKRNFMSGTRLSDGQVQFQYMEEHEAGAGVKGELKIPELFTLGMRVFEGGDAYSMEARFRYRIHEGKVLMWYDLVRPHKVHRAAVEDVFQKIKAQAKCRMMLHGRI